MDIFQCLVDDHRLITRVLGAFEQFITRVERTGEMDPAELNRFVTFLREFAELIHHDREETVLFPAMAELGYAPTGAPIAHIRDEHRRERQLLFQLRQAAVKPGPAISRKRAHVIGVVHELIAFERDHIEKENRLLYPAVQKEFAGRSLEQVSEKLFRRDGAEQRFVEDAWLRSLAEELVQDYPVARLEAI